MTIEKIPFGNLPDGRGVDKFILKNNAGMEVHIINFGGIITSLIVPDKNHEPGDVVLGFDSLEDYLSEHPYFGAIIGRVCNRIRGARFKLDGKEYKLSANQDGNQLHGGLKGFDKVLWTAHSEKTLDDVSLKLAYESADGEEGYPGNLMVEVVYSLNENSELTISMRAESDKPTHVNLTNHSYFNLNNCQGNIYDHELLINADKYTVLDEESVPTGDRVDVEGTAYDFRMAKTLGMNIEEIGMGYDINYVLDKNGKELEKVAALYDPASGRTMEVLTTQPGVQLYTSNYVDNISGKEGKIYNKHSAVCLETQHFPDACNQPSFPSTILRPGEEYNETIVLRFRTS